MDLILYFIVSFVLSALGSIPVGLITLSIMQRSIMVGKEAGLLFAVGALVPEFIYTYIALNGLRFFQQNVSVNHNIQLFSMIIFLILGLYYFFKKPQTPELPSATTTKKRRHIRDGILTASFNMLIIPFWIFIATWLSAYEFSFLAQSNILIFSLGSALGAFLIFFIYAELGRMAVHHLGSIIQYTNKALGVVFLSLGIYQFMQL